MLITYHVLLYYSCSLHPQKLYLLLISSHIFIKFPSQQVYVPSRYSLSTPLTSLHLIVSFKSLHSPRRLFNFPLTALSKSPHTCFHVPLTISLLSPKDRPLRPLTTALAPLSSPHSPSLRPFTSKRLSDLDRPLT